MGLSITRKLVNLMGGEIGVERNPDEGSTFWFVCPFRLDEMFQPDETVTTTEKLALLVSDDEGKAEDIKTLLTYAGIKCKLS